MPGTNSATTTTATTAAVISEEQASKSHRRGLIIAIAAVVVVLARTGGLPRAQPPFREGRRQGRQGENATAAAALATTNEKTAHVAISTKLSASGLGQTDGPERGRRLQPVEERGLDDRDRARPATPCQVVFKKKTIYVNRRGGLSAVLPGKTWVSATVLQLSSSVSRV